MFAVPKSDGLEPPEVLLVAPKSGLLGALPLFCCPKLKPDIFCGCVLVLELRWCCGRCAQELFTRKWCDELLSTTRCS